MWGRYYHLTRFRSHICTANFAAIHRHLHWIRQRRRQRSPSDRLWLCNATAAPHDVRTHCSSRQTHFAFSFLAPCHGRLGRHYSGSSHRYFGLRWFDLTFAVTASIRWFWLYNITFLSTHLRRSFSLSATHSAAAEKQVFEQTGEPVLENPRKISSFLGSGTATVICYRLTS